jgi:hypothetical protein
MTNTYGAPPAADQDLPRALPGLIQTDRLYTDLNIVVEKKLQERYPSALSSVIRCDELPVAYGPKRNWLHIFDHLFNFILFRPPSATLFLHIRCEEISSYTFNRVTPGDKTFRISFHTNCGWDHSDLTPGELTDCESALKENKASFMMNTVPGTGWLFNLEVQGKLK